MREALLVFSLVTAGAAGLFQLARISPLVAGNLQALIAVLFIYATYGMARRHGRAVSEGS